MQVADLQKVLRKKKVHAALLVQSLERKDPVFIALTGVSDVSGCCIIPAKGTPIFLVSPLEVQIAREHSTIRNIKALKQLNKLGLRNKLIGINGKSITLSAARLIRKQTHARLIDLSSLFDELRQKKTQQEQKKIAHAAQLAVKTLRRACAYE